MENLHETYEMNECIERSKTFGLYLRKQRTKDTLYITINDGGNIFKVSTGITCNCGLIRPRRWDSRNAELNRQIMLTRFFMCEELCNFASSDITTIKNVIFNHFRTMANKTPKSRTPRASKVIVEALDALYQPTKKTYKSYRTHVNRFIDYVSSLKDSRGGGDSLDKFKMEYIIDFRNYLTDNGLSPKTIKAAVNFIVPLINNYIAENRKYMKYVSKIEGISNVKDNTQDKKVKCLTVKQLEAFMNYIPTARQKATYDIFKLLIITGLRISDIQQILHGHYIKGENNTLIVKTQKKKEIANVILDDTIKELIATYSEYKIPGNFNDSLKSLFMDILPNDIVQYEEQHGRKVESVTESLYNVISAHWARHTFITYRRICGDPIDKIRQMVGHSNDKMINQVYSHMQAEDENRLFAKKYVQDPLKTLLKDKVKVVDNSAQYAKERYDELAEAVKQGYGNELLEANEEIDELSKNE